MPKIRINEVDLTSPGTPDRYANYAVLITGYQKAFDQETLKNATAELEDYNKILEEHRNGNKDTPLPVLSPEATTLKVREDRADINGVYEFKSTAEFKEVTGYSDADMSKKNIIEQKTKRRVLQEDGKYAEIEEVTEYHYGSKMAYELIKLGYPVVYKVINRVADMRPREFWDVFKDKASYDFRFISHGLLETCYDAAKHKKYYARKKEIESGIAILKRIESNVAADIKEATDKNENFTVSEIEKLEMCQAYFEDLVSSICDDAGNPYSSYILAAGITVDDTNENSPVIVYSEELSTGDDNKTGLYAELDSIQAKINEHNDHHVTRDVLNEINGNIAHLAAFRMDKDELESLNDGRGDCTALLELDEDIYYENINPINPATSINAKPELMIIDGINELSTEIGDNGAYCALTVPSVVYADGTKMPASFHYLACFIRSLSSGFAEWFAAAGYNRGVASAAIDHTAVKLGEIAINALEPRYLEDKPNLAQPRFACNVIAYFRGSYYLWGNRTAAALKSKAGGGDLTAEHFLNIRQLCSTLKKQVYVACRRFTFDPNSDTLWFNFVNAITPTLDAMKADQGIRDYKVVKIFTDKKATLKARIRIIPIEAVEDFDITVALEDSFGDVTVTAVG